MMRPQESQKKTISKEDYYNLLSHMNAKGNASDWP